MRPSKYVVFYNLDGERKCIELEAWHFDHALRKARELLSKRTAILCIAIHAFAESTALAGAIAEQV